MSSAGKVQRYIVLAFGTLVLISGTFCFILEKNWMMKLGPAEKVPMYISLSVALSFAYVFSIVEILVIAMLLDISARSICPHHQQYATSLYQLGRVHNLWRVLRLTLFFDGIR